MPIVDTKDFHPHTGGYWKGWHDAIGGEDASPPEHYKEQGKQDYHEGYCAGLDDLVRLPRQPHEEKDTP